MHRNLWKSIEILRGTPYKMHWNLWNAIEILGGTTYKMQQNPSKSIEIQGGKPVQNASKSVEIHRNPKGYPLKKLTKIQTNQLESSENLGGNITTRTKIKATPLKS